jgi:hypothetical protein
LKFKKFPIFLGLRWLYVVGGKIIIFLGECAGKEGGYGAESISPDGSNKQITGGTISHFQQ